MKRIVVVEDDDAIREVAASTLAFEGYRVDQARNGQEGLDLVRRKMPDCVLLDLAMPVLSGWEFMHQYREIPGRKAPVIIFTATILPKTLVAELQADAWLPKPYEVDALLDMVRTYAHSTELQEV